MKLKNCNAQKFIASLKGRKVICFGAGSSLVEREYLSGEFDSLEEHIAFFVDNDTAKQGEQYLYKKHSYDIKSPEFLKQIDVNHYVLMITCMYYVEIFQRLKDIPELKDLECYAYHLICLAPNLDVENYLTKEIEKPPYKNWKQFLHGLHLKDKHKGQRCFVIGNGPSLKESDLDCLKNEITFAANRIYLIFDKTAWRPTYYFCMDYDAYSVDHEIINQIEADLRFVPLERAMAAGKIYNEITYYHQVSNPTHIKQGKCLVNAECKFSDDCEKVIYGGRTVLYDALQMAVYMGFSEIYLLGVDCNYKTQISEDGSISRMDFQDHFSEHDGDGFVDYATPVFALLQSFQCAKEFCERKGVVIKNATRGGKLEVFERINFDSLF